MKLIIFIFIIIVIVRWWIKFNRAGMERYRYYDRLAFYNSLSDEDKESADWYMEKL